MKSFASDNYSGIHPTILESIQKVNTDHERAYGEDQYTKEAEIRFEKEFGDVKVLFTFNGTGANIVCLKCCVLPYQAVICSEHAHINVDECGAPTQSIGCTLLPVKTDNGKLTPKIIQPLLSRLGNVHNVQPRVISISQTTELGTVYSQGELKQLCDFAHQHGLYVHMDGARIANAAASLGCKLSEITVDCGIDIMSFGGTKNGLLFGEAVLIFNKELYQHAAFFQKQSAQLFSKNRFIAAQFNALLEDSLWLEMALHANKMAQMLVQNICNLPGIQITQRVDANAIFVSLPPETASELQKDYPFYEWNSETNEYRWMCSFDTSEEDINLFSQKLKLILTK